jgi:hypothetical protein
MDPGSSPGPFFRHSGLDPESMFVRLHSVIPAKAGIQVHRNEMAQDPPECSRAAGTCLTEPVTTVAGGSADNRKSPTTKGPHRLEKVVFSHKSGMGDTHDPRSLFLRPVAHGAAISGADVR